MTVLSVLELAMERLHPIFRAASIAAMSEMAFRRVTWSVAGAIVCMTLNMNDCRTSTLRLTSKYECSKSS